MMDVFNHNSEARQAIYALESMTIPNDFLLWEWESFLGWLWRHTEIVIREQWPAVVALAEQLLVKKTMGYKRAVAIIKNALDAMHQSA